MLIRDIITETTASGGIAVVAQPMTKKVIKRQGPIEKKSNKIKVGKGIYEGEERSIIRDAVIQELIDTFGESPGLFADTKEELIQRMYSELETLRVEDVVDPKMEVGGQPIGNFASGGVLGVINANDVIEDALQSVNLYDMEGYVDEGKSPHKKGTKKYKKHMAAMHAG